MSIDLLLIKKRVLWGKTQDKNEIHGLHQSFDNYHWPEGFMKI